MIDRLGRSASDVLNTVEEFARRGVKLRVLQFGGVDVTDSMGKMILTVMAACAELERNLLIERTIAGLARTQASGTRLGTPLSIPPDVMKELLFARMEGIT
jgi:DNA invertase Pin-like site-specific DNA recombinase